jgi:hypothetical protein
LCRKRVFPGTETPGNWDADGHLDLPLAATNGRNYSKPHKGSHLRREVKVQFRHLPFQLPELSH